MIVGSAGRYQNAGVLATDLNYAERKMEDAQKFFKIFGDSDCKVSAWNLTHAELVALGTLFPGKKGQVTLWRVLNRLAPGTLLKHDRKKETTQSLTWLHLAKKVADAKKAVNSGRGDDAVYCLLEPLPCQPRMPDGEEGDAAAPRTPVAGGGEADGREADGRDMSRMASARFQMVVAIKERQQAMADRDAMEESYNKLKKAEDERYKVLQREVRALKSKVSRRDAAIDRRDATIDELRTVCDIAEQYFALEEEVNEEEELDEEEEELAVRTVAEDHASNKVIRWLERRLAAQDAHIEEQDAYIEDLEDRMDMWEEKGDDLMEDPNWKEEGVREKHFSNRTRIHAYAGLADGCSVKGVEQRLLGLQAELQGNSAWEVLPSASTIARWRTDLLILSRLKVLQQMASEDPSLTLLTDGTAVKHIKAPAPNYQNFCFESANGASFREYGGK